MRLIVATTLSLPLKAIAGPDSGTSRGESLIRLFFYQPTKAVSRNGALRWREI